MDLLKKELAKQRTISLYKYQEEQISAINEQLITEGKKPLSYADIIRFSVDLAIPTIKKNLK